MTPFQQSLPMMLYRVLDSVMPAHRELFATFDVTEQQWRVLRALWDVGDASAAELAETTLLPPPSLVGIIDRLEKKGLLTRTRSLRDRRKVEIKLTETGRELQRQVTPELEVIQKQLRDSLTDEEWEQLRLSLNKLANTFTATQRAAA